MILCTTVLLQLYAAALMRDLALMLGFMSLSIASFLPAMLRCRVLVVLCINICSILENVLCALDKDVYFAAFGWNVLYISTKSI